MKHIHLLVAVLAVAGCFEDAGTTVSESETETEGSDPTDSNGPDDGSGSGTDGGTSGQDTDDGSTSGSTSGSTGDETDGSTSGSTSGSTGDETGGSTGEDPTVLEEGDLCHPIDPGALPCDPDQDLVCVYDGYNNGEGQYEWACKVFTNMANPGQYGDGCAQFLTHTDCDTGHECREQGVFPNGICEDFFCCMPECNPLIGGIDCPNNTFCSSHHPDENFYPPVIQNSAITTIGDCGL